jgi:protein TonB
MTRPVADTTELQRSGYTREAREAQIQGMMIVKCKVLADGTVQDCRVIKTLPFLAEAVVKRLEAMKVKPATFQGKAVSVDYVFNFNFKMPH